MYPFIKTTTNMIVILDLDGTLVAGNNYSCPLDDDDRQMSDFSLEYSLTDNYIYQLRPGIKEFLSWLFEHHRVVVWSANPDYHVKKLVEKIFGSLASKIERIYDVKHCSVTSIGLHERVFVKPVSIVAKELGDSCILIDDRECNVSYNPGSALLIPTYKFIFDRHKLEVIPSDNELALCIEKLKNIACDGK